MPSLYSFSGNTAAAAAPVKPVTGEASAPPALHEFTLVSFDKFGYPLPLPPGLDDLPLYPHDDGFFSVNGPLGLRSFYANLALTPVNGANRSIIHPLITNIPGPVDEKSPSTPDYHLRYYNNDTISRLATSPRFRAPYGSLLSNGSGVGHKHVLKEESTSAPSLVAPGNPHFQQSRHWTAIVK